MRRTAAVLVLLLTTTTVDANSPPPGFKNISRDIHVEFAEAYPGFTFFVVSGQAKRVSSTEGDVLLNRFVRGGYINYLQAFRLCAVPDDMLADFRGDEPDWKWFQANNDNPRLRWATFSPAGDESLMTDPRGRIVQKYRVTLTPTALEKELLWEYTIPDWGAAVGWLMFLTAIAALVWWLRRKHRRQPAARTPPLPGN